MPTDYERLSCDLVRALRGPRSQLQLSRMLGYRTNVVYRWEAGTRWPAARGWLALARRVQAPLDRALAALSPAAVEVTRNLEVSSRTFVQAILSAVVDTKLSTLAAAAGLPVHTTRRVLRGETQPNLPVFLRLLEAATGRLAPFLETLVGTAPLDALGPSWRISLEQRAVYRAHPWAEAVLAVVECAAYRKRSTHSDRWLADRLGIPQEDVQGTIQALVAVGGLVWESGNLRTQPMRATHLSAAEAARLRTHWAGQVVALGEDRSRTGYIVFSCSDDGLAQVRAVLAQAFGDIRKIIDQDAEPTRAVLMTTSLAALDGTPLPTSS